MTALGSKPRLYYDCPLKAAYMVKHHGMRFQVDDGGTLNTIVVGMEHLTQSVSGRFYIHPNSLHLLEPQAGDIYISQDTVCQIKELDRGIITEITVEWECRDRYPANKFDGKIIFRSGKAFHWPESEAA